MKIKTQSSVTITTNTYQIETKYGLVTYIEYVNGKNKVTDWDLRSTNIGQEIDDLDLLKEIQDLVDNGE